MHHKESRLLLSYAILFFSVLAVSSFVALMWLSEADYTPSTSEIDVPNYLNLQLLPQD